MTDTPETDILEAVARAIYEKDNPHGKWEIILSWVNQSNDEYAEEEVARYRGMARAALTVALDHMQSPSEDMLVAGCGKPMQPFGQKTSGQVWQAMLDKFIEETLP